MTPVYLVIYVSHDIEQADAVLHEWVKAGIDGATILESSGMQQLGGKQWRDDLGIIPTLSNILRSRETHHRTLMSAIRNEAVVKRVIQATTDYVTDWSLPDVGILLVLPVMQAFGLEKGIPSRSAS